MATASWEEAKKFALAGGTAKYGDYDNYVKQASTKMASMYSPTAPTAATQPTTPKPPTDYRSALTNAANQLSQSRPQFQYNAASDDALKAAANIVRSGVGLAQANTNARLRAGGQGRSSYSEAVGHQIAQNAENDINTRLVPMYEERAYNRFNTDQERARQAAIDMLTVGQGFNTLDQQDRDQTYRDETLALDKGQVTGSYLPPVAQRYIEEALANKRKWLSAAPEEQQRLAARNQELYGALQGMNIDPSSINQDVDISDAVGNATRLGIPTLQRQQMDYNQQTDQRDFNRLVSRDARTDQVEDRNFNAGQEDLEYNRAYQATRDLIEDDKWKMKFDEDVRQYGIDSALQRQVQLGNLSIAQANQALSQQRLDFDKKQASQPKEQKTSPSAYKSSPDYAQDYQFVKNNPEQAKQSLQTNAADFINEYGFDGYMDLLKGLPKEDQDETMKLLESILGG